MRENVLWALLVVFVPFSLASVGGAPSIFAGIQHQAVDVRGWVSAREFLDLFAIARAAPGPGSMLVTLIGWHIAGWAGAIVATLALFVPSSILCYRERSWHVAVENGLAPVGAGLILAGVIAIARLSETGYTWWAVVATSAAVLLYAPKIYPLLMLAAGGLAFVFCDFAAT